MLISDTYRQLNADLHSNEAFGVSGYRWADSIAWIAHHHQITQILDYGAGQQTLKQSLAANSNVTVDCYDPAIPELSATPKPTEMVTCTDVLEHIEPSSIDAVLDDLQRIALRNAFLVIPTGPAAKTLADGRNAHLIQQPIQWWLPKIIKRFDIISVNHMTDSIVIFCSKKQAINSNLQNILLNFISSNVKNKIQSISFDGFYWHISLKAKIIAPRLLARFISIAHLGRKFGATEKIKVLGSLSKICLTNY